LNILSLLIIVPATLICIALGSTGHMLSVLAILITGVSAIPLLIAKRLDFFAPWTYLFYYVFLNVLIRLVFVDFEVNGDVTDINGIFHLGKPREFMVESASVLFLGFIFLTVGYLGVKSRRLPLKYRIFISDRYNNKRIKFSITFLIGVSLCSFVAFLRLTFTGIGEFAIQMLSQHRGLSEDLAEYNAYGYLRLLIGLSTIVVYLSYIQLIKNNKDRAFFRTTFIVGMTLTLAMALYSQSRAALVLTFFNLIFLTYYIRGNRFPWKLFLLMLPAAVIFFTITSAFRGGSGVSLESKVTPMVVIAPIVLNIGGIDASKTGHIIDYIDATQDFKLGSTLGQFVIAMVPRQLWLTKPVNIDTLIGEEIYGATIYGAGAVPPGFIAEMYMNFWYVGIVFGCLMLGGGMKLIQNILTANKGNHNFILIYVLVLQSFGMSVMGSSFSSAMIGSLMSGAPLLIILYYITLKPAKNHND
jgi:oligosaccharide repeat unit polymerase